MGKYLPNNVSSILLDGYLKFCKKNWIINLQFKGSLGASISDAGFAKLPEVCGDAAERANIKKMWFTKTGQSYQHVFASTNVSLILSYSFMYSIRIPHNL